MAEDDTATAAARSLVLEHAKDNKPNRIFTGLLSVGQYPVLIWQSPMKAMFWPESRISHGKVIIHPAQTGVLCLQRQVGRISKIILC